MVLRPNALKSSYFSHSKCYKNHVYEGNYLKLVSYGGTYSVRYLVASSSVFGDVCDCVEAYECRERCSGMASVVCV